MNFNKYTIKAQEAIQQATTYTSENSQQAIETGHILKAILNGDESIGNYILKKLNVNKSYFDLKLEEQILIYPKVSGANVQPYLSNEAAFALQKAEVYMKEFKDEYVAIEHILLGLLAGRDKTASLMKEQGFNEKHLKAAIVELRDRKSVV